MLLVTLFFFFFFFFIDTEDVVGGREVFDLTALVAGFGKLQKQGKEDRTEVVLVRRNEERSIQRETQTEETERALTRTVSF
jgi:hypothetical protein